MKLRTRNLHLDSGEHAAAVVECVPGEPLRIDFDSTASTDIELPASVHVALGRVDPHVHFRESLIPTREQYESDPYHDPSIDYETLVKNAERANDGYDARRGSLAALKGGVWLVGCMGNTPWGPVGEERWRATSEQYQSNSPIVTHVWPRIEPGVPPVPGQEEKDFGSTFGGSGLSSESRRAMYLERSGGMVSYHNDRARLGESIEAFRERTSPPSFMLHHLYYDGETVLGCQRETLTLASEANLKRLLTRHIPTGPALAMLLDARPDYETELPCEVGLDYLYFNRDMLESRATRAINYRRPALPSEKDQLSLIALTLEQARLRDPLTFIGSDHAPHSPEAKQPRPNGMPGAPGTRVLEHTTQILMNLIHQHGYSHADIDWLTSIAPAKHMAQYKTFPFPLGTMRDGAMANLVAFDPDEAWRVDENHLRLQLEDKHYHSAYRDESLTGRTLFTVVNGSVYDVSNDIRLLNG